MIIRAQFIKKNYLRYISHLDVMRLFHRSLNRGEILIKYSEGFNPHPKLSVANPLSLGIESEGEFIDLDLVEDITIEEFMSRINKALPEDVQIIKAAYLEREKSISAMISWASYEIKFQTFGACDLDIMAKDISMWIKREEILISKLKKKGKNMAMSDVNIAPLIGNIVVKAIDEDKFIEINALLKCGENGNLKPIDLMDSLNRDLKLGIDMDSVMLKRLAQYADNNGEIYSPL